MQNAECRMQNTNPESAACYLIHFMNTIIPSFQRSNIPLPSVRLFASAKSWIEGEALRQFHAAAHLEGVRLAVGFPDLHPGKGSAVGAAFVTEGVIYPYLIGSDIGCG